MTDKLAGKYPELTVASINGGNRLQEVLDENTIEIESPAFNVLVSGDGVYVISMFSGKEESV